MDLLRRPRPPRSALLFGFGFVISATVFGLRSLKFQTRFARRLGQGRQLAQYQHRLAVLALDLAVITRAAAIKHNGLDALGERGFAASLPRILAPATLAASLSRSGVALPVVEAAARVTPALSSMNWT